MDSLRIDIVNPRARKIIEELAELKLIMIKDEAPVKSFQKLLIKLRGKDDKLSLDEISKEVELVRGKRHGKKA